MVTAIIARPAQTIQWEDGVHFDPAIGEHRVIVGGQTVNYATHWSTAIAQFKEACRVRREHRLSNPIEVMA